MDIKTRIKFRKNGFIGDVIAIEKKMKDRGKGKLEEKWERRSITERRKSVSGRE